MDKKELHRIVEGLYPSVVKLRRKIHRTPELSGHEQGTAALVAQELKRIGLAPRFFLGKTAVVCLIQSGKGKTAVLRADTDALPISEKSGLPFASTRPGVMHACGHDFHTAILAGAAQALVRLRPQWRGSVALLFQPSEESEPGGAQGLIRAGAFPRGAEAVFGLHVSTDHETGQIGLRAGCDYAGVLNFAVTVVGRGGHCAAPQATINPIACAAAMIARLQELTHLQGSSARDGGAVVSVGTFEAGTRSNIVPDEAVFTGTIRTHSKRREALIKRRVERIVADAARAHRAKAAIAFELSYPPTNNDLRLSERMQGALRGLLGSRRVIVRPSPIYYAEDFAYYQQKAPGLYAHLGVRPPGQRVVPGIHNARFNPDEEAMKTGILAHVAFALEILGQ